MLAFQTMQPTHDGELVITFDLNDAVSTFKIKASAMTEHSFGMASNSLQSLSAFYIES